MTERPIIFSGPMVRAILDGRKTQTRRIVKPQPELTDGSGFKWKGWLYGRGAGDAETVRNFARQCCPYGVPGDRLWVREAWAVSHVLDHLKPREVPQGSGMVYYAATESLGGLLKRPSIFMPRWASRLTLEVVGVRVERLQEISEEDAVAEGLVPYISGKWWQGYRRLESGRLMHQQHRGEAPPEWMIEPHDMGDSSHLDHPAKEQFRGLWNCINAKRAPWESNPWVWAIEFRRVT